MARELWRLLLLLLLLLLLQLLQLQLLMLLLLLLLCLRVARGPHLRQQNAEHVFQCFQPPLGAPGLRLVLPRLWALAWRHALAAAAAAAAAAAVAK